MVSLAHSQPPWHPGSELNRYLILNDSSHSLFILFSFLPISCRVLPDKSKSGSKSGVETVPMTRIINHH